MYSHSTMVCPNCGDVLNELVFQHSEKGRSPRGSNRYLALRLRKEQQLNHCETDTRSTLQTHLDRLARPPTYPEKDWTGILAAVVGSECKPNQRYSEALFQQIICSMAAAFYLILHKTHEIESQLYYLNYHRETIFSVKHLYTSKYKVYFDIPLAESILTQYIAKYYL
jgi:hypothetical protein